LTVYWRGRTVRKLLVKGYELQCEEDEEEKEEKVGEVAEEV
jgi:hypothetical protein